MNFSMKLCASNVIINPFIISSVCVKKGNLLQTLNHSSLMEVKLNVPIRIVI